MKERLTNLLRELDFFLNNSPIEDDCTDKENEMYSDMANLKNSIEAVLEDM
jgi:hypothetical protein